ncbi:MAG: Lrp/AsnC family transcriptional regulator [Gemmatimonadota bacterium]|nr:Lrp/AsnC family transcriptional regulator [Gemmatimonadota bacterium]
MEKLSERDKTLIRLLQEGLPVCAEPYAEIAARAGLPESEVIGKVGGWLAQGVIRRLGATVRHREVGYRANCMVVWKLGDQARHREVGTLFSSFSQVSHCYRRPAFEDWPYTLYTMVHGPHREDIHSTVARMSSASGIEDYLMVFSVKEWKKTAKKYFSEKEKD